MKIYWIKAQAPRQVLALAKHLGIGAEYVQAVKQLKTPEYTALNPNMKAPVLVDGHTVLWEASAIMAYLCIKANSDMWPAHAPEEQVEVLRWLGWNDCHWAPAVGPFYFEHVVKKTFNLGPPDREALKAGMEALLRYARVLDNHLRERDFLSCDRLTIADFRAAAMAAHWHEAEMPLEAFPNVVRWLDRLMLIPAWKEPWPE